MNLVHRARRLIRREMGTDPGAHVHFHTGPQGRPVPCFDTGCSTPRLSVK
jgi:hypothetical protein